jgi:hypothetical protein
MFSWHSVKFVHPTIGRLISDFFAKSPESTTTSDLANWNSASQYQDLIPYYAMSVSKHVVFDVVGTCVSYQAFFDGGPSPIPHSFLLLPCPEPNLTSYSSQAYRTRASRAWYPISGLCVRLDGSRGTRIHLPLHLTPLCFILLCLP